ncbi:MAG: hypothetical protein A2725_03865 [Candidatus Magasanikbacteria bacterium RIFCSPHIGHO2_01_FULL_33_34]|uniref:histidine kinase n=1 Tax=Candidatus Magasanikbacteria bacterium RIFCSPHIGHO2_01_FULL_33_34 TaxID=1798671 RepID=A0A1F6LHQ8_9BACT|nr:MAG: hypothetical protein A2725_03865 [Candidatus Magasanikbacteria bacterium RIFCSPHIGHO2_01_FULL_33_34]OGH65107.1 MAG: hypothetical protein A3B83_03625 [Candidatus Magasanikbacteria bacterium RIFCSPHIGHO2_02_FULL_33_17]OGH75349.1 MAG: hypothetical protein A3A89_04540 [Candidatus Magasanikbacteria bacterium RIFCSPLOWO2_01_FULL_33_34]OGH81817.1 MAG: hypothetical protein A3F93_03520 [Candidatus Magasanikbacteria bacterium RIFCSPLOWO2_12_FULL_34_7]
MRLNTKIFLNFILGAIMLSTILAVVFYKDLSNILKNQQISERQQEIVLRKNSTEHFLVMSESSINFLSGLSSIKQYTNTDDQLEKISAHKKISDEFKTFLMNNMIFSKIELIDENGQELIVVNWDEENKIISRPPNKLENVKQFHFFNETMKLNKRELFVSITEDEHADTIENTTEDMSEMDTSKDNKLTHNKHQIIEYSTPIYNEQDQLKGILILDLFSDFTFKGSNTNHPNMNIRNMAMTSEDSSLKNIYLVNSFGYYLQNIDKDKEWGFMTQNDVTIFNDYPQIKPIIQELDSGQIYNEEDKSYLIFHRINPYSANVKKIYMGIREQSSEDAKDFTYANDKDTFWTQILRVEQAEIIDKVNILFFKTLSLIILILIFFVVLMMFFLQQVVLNPVEKIIQGAERIKKGNLDYKLSLGNRKDEFGDLANEFNSMSAVLKRYKETMEQKIYERTSDLEKFKNAIEVTREAVVITDPEGTILYANNSVERMTGYSKNEIINKKVGTSQLWGGIMTPEFYTKLWKTIKTDKKPFVGKIKNKNKNGIEYSTLLSITPMLDKKGDILYFFSIENDLNDLNL